MLDAWHFQIEEAVARLRAGGLVAFPTETVYGLGADALNAAAVRRVFEVKGRPSHNPLIVHVADAEMARTVVSEWPEEAELLAREFWPGPLTIVLPKRDVVPDEVSAGGPTVGVRCPDHAATLSLLREFGGPLVGPSANPSGRVSPTTAEHVREAFTPEQVFVVDGGACEGGIESTVVKLGTEVRVLRAGLVTPDAIERVLGRPVLVGGGAGAVSESPGQLASHYAPRTPTFLVAEGELATALSQPGRACVVASEGAIVAAPHVLVAMPTEPEEYAASMYSALREADASGAARILVVRPVVQGTAAQQGVWMAILDRLTRAATPP